VRATWRVLTAKAETFPALALSVLSVAAVGVAAGWTFGRDWLTVLYVTVPMTLAFGIGGAIRIFWSRSGRAPLSLDQQPPSRRLD
jgi:hypothetical protein